MYIYSPAEPFGVPVQPGPDIYEPSIYGRVDSVTRGRCSNCAACPKVWQLEIPIGLGEDFFAGTYYLRRNVYVYRGALSEFEYQTCSFGSGLAWQPDPCPIVGASPYHGSDQHGWVLYFGYEGGAGGYGWFLRSPLYEEGFHSYRSLYKFFEGPEYWRCLQSNTLRYFAPWAEFDYPVTPEAIAVTPFYG